MISEPLISVIISAYNSEDSIRKCIESILNQTYKNLEILIIDDYSSDNTFNIIESLTNSDSRVRLFRNTKNIGLTLNLNKLLAISTGDYIARQDADDFSNLTRFEKQLNYLQKNNLDAVCSLAEDTTKNKTYPGLSKYFNPRIVMKFKNPFIHGTLLVSKKAIEAVNFYDESFKFAQDYKLYNDLFEKNFKIKNMFESLYFINTVDNISSKFRKEQKDFAIKVKKIYKF